MVIDTRHGPLPYISLIVQKPSAKEKRGHPTRGYQVTLRNLLSTGDVRAHFGFGGRTKMTQDQALRAAKAWRNKTIRRALEANPDLSTAKREALRKALRT